MPVIKSQLNPRSEEFRANAARSLRADAIGVLIDAMNGLRSASSLKALSAALRQTT